MDRRRDSMLAEVGHERRCRGTGRLPVAAAGAGIPATYECPGCPDCRPKTRAIQEDVIAFHIANDLTVGSRPGIRDPERSANLILEEARETVESITGYRVVTTYDLSEHPERPQSLAGAIDGLCDLLAVVYGAAVTFGVDLGPFWAEVHRANMEKVGGPRRADGKVLRPSGWRPPDTEGLLEELYGFREEAA